MPRAIPAILSPGSPRSTNRGAQKQISRRGTLVPHGHNRCSTSGRDRGTECSWCMGSGCMSPPASRLSPARVTRSLLTNMVLPDAPDFCTMLMPHSPTWQWPSCGGGDCSERCRSLFAPRPAGRHNSMFSRNTPYFRWAVQLWASLSHNVPRVATGWRGRVFALSVSYASSRPKCPD